MKDNNFRHEIKYICGEFELQMIKNRINHLMLYDSNVGENGKYTIRSVYFDHLDNRCYYENEYGTDPREKFRIRIYNSATDSIKLEQKSKVNGKVQKQSCDLTIAQCEALLNNEYITPSADKPKLLNKLLLQKLTTGLKPKVIVEYDREPFVYKQGNVRVTFDRDIRSSNDISKFLEERIHTRLILPTGRHVLEVKYDELIPDFIYNSVQIPNLQQTAFSKYYLCRKFTIGGKENDIF